MLWRTLRVLENRVGILTGDVGDDGRRQNASILERRVDLRGSLKILEEWCGASQAHGPMATCISKKIKVDQLTFSGMNSWCRLAGQILLQSLIYSSHPVRPITSRLQRIG